MCGGPEHSRAVSSHRSYRMSLADESARLGLSRSDGSLKHQTNAQQQHNSNNSSSSSSGSGSSSSIGALLEFAADNDLEAFRKAVDEGLQIDEEGSWYMRRIGIRKMGLERRTPLMIAATYGSVEVLSYILANGGAEVNRACGEDGVTALHCAAAGGSFRAAEVVQLLLSRGASKNALDAQGRRPSDVLQPSPKLLRLRVVLEALLSDVPDKAGAAKEQAEAYMEPKDGFVSMSSYSSPCSSPDSFSPALSPQSPSSPKVAVEVCSDGSEKSREFLSDPSLPDIKNSIYATDEFRMFSFKVRPCSRAYSHDWTECPFVHPGENARRRDPRKYHYSCVPCPDFRKGACRRGDACEYAHGVFECWLHPAQYRTRLCKEGTSCARRVCFFAHTSEELRPLLVSASATPSPRASSPLDVRSMSPPLSAAAAAQSPVLKVPPFSPSNASASGLSTPPLSPSGGSWSQQSSVPTLLLPTGASLHASRLRAAFSARDIPADEYRSSEVDGHLASEFSNLGRQTTAAAVLMGSGSATPRGVSKFGNLGLNIPPTNLQDLFSSEGSSLPVHQEHACMSPQLQSQLQLQQLLSPMAMHSGHVSPQLQSPTMFSGGSPRSFSRRSELESLQCLDSLHARKAAAFAQRERGSWSLKDIQASAANTGGAAAAGAAAASSSSLSDWGSPSGKPDWGMQGQELGSCKFRKSASFGVEPDVSWVQTLVKDGPSDGENRDEDAVLCGWDHNKKNSSGSSSSGSSSSGGSSSSSSSSSNSQQLLNSGELR